MSAKKIHKAGERFGMLTIICEADTLKKGGHVRFLCVCDCGTQRVIAGFRLRNDGVKSCGCLSVKQAKENIKLTPNYQKKIQRERLAGSK